LAALLATGLLIAAGPRSCERRAPALVPDTPSIRPAPPRAGAQPPPVARAEQRPRRPHRQRHRKREHRRRHHVAAGAPRVTPLPSPLPAHAATPHVITPRIRPHPRPQRPATPEFL